MIEALLVLNTLLALVGVWQREKRMKMVKADRWRKWYRDTWTPLKGGK